MACLEQQGYLTREGLHPTGPIRDQFNLHKLCLEVSRRHNSEEDDSPFLLFQKNTLRDRTLFWDF